MKLLEEIVFRCLPTGKYLIDPKSQVALTVGKFDLHDQKTWPKKAGTYRTNMPGLWPWPVAAEEYHAEWWFHSGITKYVLDDDVTKELAK